MEVFLVIHLDRGDTLDLYCDNCSLEGKVMVDHLSFYVSLSHVNNSQWLTNITQMNTKNEYDFLAASSKYDDVDSITDLQFSSGELCENFDAIHGSYQAESSAQRSVIQSHGLSSVVEKN